jgi:glutathionyl-hydroquinone reductase
LLQIIIVGTSTSTIAHPDSIKTMSTDGKISLTWANTKGGEFVRQVSSFRSFIGQDPRFPAEANRYHLYGKYQIME